MDVRRTPSPRSSVRTPSLRAASCPIDFPSEKDRATLEEMKGLLSMVTHDGGFRKKRGKTGGGALSLCNLILMGTIFVVLSGSATGVWWFATTVWGVKYVRETLIENIATACMPEQFSKIYDNTMRQNQDVSTNCALLKSLFMDLVNTGTEIFKDQIEAAKQLAKDKAQNRVLTIWKGLNDKICANNCKLHTA